MEARYENGILGITKRNFDFDGKQFSKHQSITIFAKSSKTALIRPNNVVFVGGHNGGFPNLFPKCENQCWWVPLEYIMINCTQKRTDIYEVQK